MCHRFVWFPVFVFGAAFLVSAARAGVVVVSPPGATGSGTCTLVDAVTTANTGTATGGCTLSGSSGSGGDGFSSGNVVELQAGTYVLTQANNDWYGPDALPAISGNVVIVGSPEGSVIEAEPSTGPLRLFYVGGGESLTNYDPPPGLTSLPGPGTLELVNLTVEGGLAEGGGSNGGGGGLGAGGAIYDQGTVILSGVTLVGNEAVGGAPGQSGGYGGGGMGGGSDNNGDGGGFNFPSGLWTPPGFTGTSYGEFGNGGAVSASGDGQTGGVGGGGGDSAAFAGGNGGFGGGGGFGSNGVGGNGGFGGGGAESNSAGAGGFGAGSSGGGGAGLGGAVFVEGGTLRVTNSTLTDNSAVGGDGIGVGGDGLGGAIFDLNGTVTITYSTIAGNTVAAGSGGSGGASGQAAANGVFEVYLPTPGSPAADASKAVSVTIDSSILWGNIDHSTNTTSNCEVGDPAYLGTSFTGTDDVVGNAGTTLTVEGTGSVQAVACGFAGPVTGDPDLSPPLDNGGPTVTMAVGPGSSAIGIGNVATAPAVDQRGDARGSPPDAGAYQYGASPVPVTLSTLTNLSVPEGSTASEPLTVTGLGPLTLTATSSDGAFVPSSAITVNCSPVLSFNQEGTEDCTLGFPPASAAGSVAVTVSATSGYGATASGSLVYTVAAEAPTVSGLSNETVEVGQAVPAVSFTLGGQGPFAVSVASTNEALLPVAFVTVSPGCGTTTTHCTLTLDPTAGATGTSTVVVEAKSASGQTAVGTMVLTVETAAAYASSQGGAETGGGTGAFGELSLLGLGALAVWAEVRKRWGTPAG